MDKVNKIGLALEIFVRDKSGVIKHREVKKADTFLKNFASTLYGRIFTGYRYAPIVDLTNVVRAIDWTYEYPTWGLFAAYTTLGIDSYGIVVGSNDSGPDVTDSTYASASSTHSSVVGPGGGFDNIIDVGGGGTHRWVSNVLPTPSAPEWLKQDFGSGVTKTIVRYTLDNGGNGPSEVAKDWTFEGSNDDSNWDVLDTQTGQDYTNKTTYNFSNTTAYRYYRILITALNSGSNAAIYEMEMMEAGVSPVNYDDYKLWSKISHSLTGLCYHILYSELDVPDTGKLTLKRFFENKQNVSDIVVKEIGIQLYYAAFPFLVARDNITPVTLIPGDVLSVKYIISWL